MYEDIKHKQRFLLELVESIEEHGTVCPIIDTFYETYNGSYVYVYKHRSESSLPDGLSDDMKTMLMDSIIGKLIRGKDSEFFKALVLRGGHGLKPNGEKPGESYTLNAEGGYSVSGSDEDLMLNFPLIVGLGLRRTVGHIDFIDTIAKA